MLENSPGTDALSIAVQGLTCAYSGASTKRRNSFFMGCQMDPDVFQNLIERSATCFPAQPELPFAPFAVICTPAPVSADMNEEASILC